MGRKMGPEAYAAFCRMRAGGKRYRNEQRERALLRRVRVKQMLLDGIPVKDIAQIEGVSPTTIYNDKNWIEAGRQKRNQCPTCGTVLHRRGQRR